MALETSAENAVPVRTLARLLGDWIGRLGRVWVEGQIADLRQRPGFGTVFVTLRDPVANVSVPLALSRDLAAGLQEGTRVVAWVQPGYRYDRGAISLTAYDVRPVGVGELLARLERLKAVLAAEGLFAPARKRPLPFLPQTVGLVCGRASAAEHDVVENATRRWPDVRFRVAEVAVQGVYAVPEVIAAVQRLDADPAVDVIVVTRGGGSVEDLLPFSDEALCRAVASCRTPVVSAIGHEQDSPLLDLVADRRASTPTDAAKLVVPDVAEERERVAGLRRRARRSASQRVEAETSWLAALRSRPVLAAPLAALAARQADVAGHRERTRRCLHLAITTAEHDVAHTRARVTALSPAATLARGYAVVQRADGAVVRGPGDVAAGQRVRLRLAEGELAATIGPAQ